MNTYLKFMAVASLVMVQARISSREVCTSGDTEYCGKFDYEGACCAKVTVVTVAADSTEAVDDSFLRCYAIDDVIKAVDGND